MYNIGIQSITTCCTQTHFASCKYTPPLLKICFIIHPLLFPKIQCVQCLVLYMWNLLFLPLQISFEWCIVSKKFSCMNKFHFERILLLSSNVLCQFFQTKPWEVNCKRKMSINVCLSLFNVYKKRKKIGNWKCPQGCNE